MGVGGSKRRAVGLSRLITAPARHLLCKPMNKLPDPIMGLPLLPLTTFQGECNGKVGLHRKGEPKELTLKCVCILVIC